MPTPAWAPSGDYYNKGIPKGNPPGSSSHFRLRGVACMQPWIATHYEGVGCGLRYLFDRGINIDRQHKFPTSPQHFSNNIVENEVRMRRCRWNEIWAFRKECAHALVWFSADLRYLSIGCMTYARVCSRYKAPMFFSVLGEKNQYILRRRRAKTFIGEKTALDLFMEN